MTAYQTSMTNLNAYLDAPIDDLPSDEKTVPNKQPLLTGYPYKIAIIGEAPGSDEVAQGTPFVGRSGRFLNDLLSKAGIVREACFIGNVCQHSPPKNRIEAFSRDGDQFTMGLEQLARDLGEFQPNLCVLLGNTALWAAKDRASVKDWRGSVFVSDKQGPLYGLKCLPSWHPAACLREYKFTPILTFDLKKAARHATTKDFVPPYRDLLVDWDPSLVVSRLDDIIARKPLIAIDIEGTVKNFSCISVAESASRVFIVPFTTMSGDNLYADVDDEVLIWRRLATVLADPAIPKVLQNSLYDRFVLQYSYATIIRGVVEDTMLKHWELYSELEKSLGFQASIYTDEPFYKSDRKDPDREVFWRYCCRDSAVTYEINSALTRWLADRRAEHYHSNVALLNPFLYMELRGIRYDSKRAAARLDEVELYIHERQEKLDRLAGVGLPEHITAGQLLATARETLCYKRDQDRPKKDNEYAYLRIKELCQRGTALTPIERGEVAIHLRLSMNIKSPAFKTFLYEKLGLPKQYKTDDDGNQTLTADYEALLKLSKKTDSQAVRLAMEIGMLRTRAQMLRISADPDGRVRCGYNAVGTNTGRVTCYTSPTGSGYNLQTIPDTNNLQPEGHPLRLGMRDLFVADPGNWMFQCDLSGADGWTVAAHLAALGDPTMLDDYLYGIKPAKVLCYLLRHGAAVLQGKSREEIKTLTSPIKSSDWDYFACKVGQHGTSYLMGPIQLSNKVLEDSEGLMSITANEAKDLQKLFVIRYRLKLWHDATARALARKPEITAASGFTRRFFGRKDEILGQALAHEPQANTTYVTNCAADKLWRDTENREIVAGLHGPRLKTEPLHQVHDALVGQFKQTTTEWSLGKIKGYFHNPITIAGIPILIPFEGKYGSSWGTLDHKFA